MHARAYIQFIAITSVFLLASCSGHVDRFNIAVHNASGSDISNFQMAFMGRQNTMDFGFVPRGGLHTANFLAGPVPDAVDINWTDNAGGSHRQHFQINPLPADTSYVYGSPEVCFEIEADRTVKLLYRLPNIVE